MQLPDVSWQTLDWAALDRLREIFLAGKPPPKPYWTSLSDLANYDFTFGERIGWKWDALLAELRERGWTPPASDVLDWGCGSGIAGRRVIASFGQERFRRLRVFDRSTLAMDYALARARREFPTLTVEAATDSGEMASPAAARPGGGDAPISLSGGHHPGAAPIGLLVVSHVLGELSEDGGRALRQAIDRAAAVLWVEPGTYADSRALIAVREAVRHDFLVIAPCTHQTFCGLLTPENQRHWCHHFAPPPPNLMADSNWVRFARRAGIDLRRLPYSFLVLERKGLRHPVPGLLPADRARVIGSPRFYKAYAKVSTCQQDGVRDLKLERKVAPLLFKQLKQAVAPGVHAWQIVQGRITQVLSSPPALGTSQGAPEGGPTST